MINSAGFDSPSLRNPQLGTYPLMAFQQALHEYKSNETFQKTILYSKRMLEEMVAMLDDGKLYTQTIGMEDYIGQRFKLKAKSSVIKRE